MNTPGSTDRFGFGDFVVDVAARQLTRGRVGVPLAPKAFDLLVLLLRQRPGVLSREYLLSQLWPGTFVSDASLATAVAELRAALGESASRPQFVRTVHRHGYAFQGSASVLPSAASSPGRAMPVVDFWLVTDAKEIPLSAGDNVVGRDPRMAIWLDSPSVSRQHARLTVGTSVATVEDLGSKNGTFRGEERVVSPTRLNDGDRLRFGKVPMVFRALILEPTRTEGGGC